MKRILGISAFYHDSAAALVIDGEVIAAAQEERFTRKKHDYSFPINAIKFCLEFSDLDINEIDAIVFYDKPLLKFERILETYYVNAPKGLASFVKAMPVWLKEKMFIKKNILDELSAHFALNKKVKLLFPEHHLSHAASAFYPSPYSKSAILTIDGVGEWATASISLGENNNITILKELHFPNSLGLLYSSFTYFLGFKVNSGEYKLMGLAPYGIAGSKEVENFISIIKKNLITIKADGSIDLNQKYFNYSTGLRMVKDKKWENLFGFKKRQTDEPLELYHCNLGLAIQQITEEVVQKMAIEAKKLTNADYLCLAGGVALNCVSNGKLQKEAIFKEIFIQPASGDAGGALGAALAAYHIYYGSERKTSIGLLDSMKGSYLGPEIKTDEIKSVCKKYMAKGHFYSNFEDLIKDVAVLIDKGNIIGWVQGRMEFGPRALGGRSIIADPRNSEMQKKLNLKIKYRESFRPFAPSILSEDCNKYFKYDGISPYMLLVHEINDGIKKEVPHNYSQLPIREKLYHDRSVLPAITHIDYTGRIQTVHKETNNKYWQLINAFKQLTGCSAVVNTSFNVRGEPIVNTANDAYRCFMRTDMDYLVIENYLFKKDEQPNWLEKDNWEEEFTLD